MNRTAEDGEVERMAGDGEINRMAGGVEGALEMAAAVESVTMAGKLSDSDQEGAKTRAAGFGPLRARG